MFVFSKSIQIRLAIIASSTFIAMATSMPVHANEDKNPTWILEANTTSGMHDRLPAAAPNLIKATVDYFQTCGDASDRKRFEDIWYCDGKAIGLDRKSQLGIAAAQPVKIQIVESRTPTDAENKAATNLAMRLIVSVLLNKDKLSVVTVPDANYNNVLQELQARHANVCVSGEKPPVNAPVAFQLQSQSQASATARTVYFF